MPTHDILDNREGILLEHVKTYSGIPLVQNSQSAISFFSKLQWNHGRMG